MTIPSPPISCWSRLSRLFTRSERCPRCHGKGWCLITKEEAAATGVEYLIEATKAEWPAPAAVVCPVCDGEGAKP